MALRGTLTHWKTILLAHELKIDPAFAMGVLEALWHVTAKDTPTGCIGHLSNHGIAMRMFSTIDPDVLIETLIKSGHLDKHPEHRLIVHDWSEHSDDAVDNRLARHGLYYADGRQPRMRRMRKEERERVSQQIWLFIGKPDRILCARNTTAHQDTTEHHDAALPEARGQKPEARSQNPVNSTEALENVDRFEKNSGGGGETSPDTATKRRRTKEPPPQYPAMQAAASAFFPPQRSDAGSMVVLARVIHGKVPEASDEVIAEAMKNTYRSDFRGPMAWGPVVTAYLLNGHKKAKKAPKIACQRCQDNRVILRPELPDHGPKLLAAIEAGNAYVRLPGVQEHAKPAP